MSGTDLELRYSARNYRPLPVELTRGRGIYLWDVAGRRYIDMMSAYSAVSFGHANPELLAVLTEQAERLAVTSRAFHTDRLGPFLERLCQVTRMDRALPMNTGAEAVETAIKAARKWAYKVKGVAAERAEIIVCSGNFAGAHDDDRRLLERGAVPRRLRAVRTGLPPRSVRRPAGARAGDHARHCRVHRRAGSGRSRRYRPAGRISVRVRRDLQAPRRPPDLRRGPDRPRTDRTHPRLRS